MYTLSKDGDEPWSLQFLEETAVASLFEMVYYQAIATSHLQTFADPLAELGEMDIEIARCLHYGSVLHGIDLAATDPPTGSSAFPPPAGSSSASAPPDPEQPPEGSSASVPPDPEQPPTESSSASVPPEPEDPSVLREGDFGTIDAAAIAGFVFQQALVIQVVQIVDSTGVIAVLAQNVVTANGTPLIRGMMLLTSTTAVTKITDPAMIARLMQDATG